jgi:hypothetical protein
MDAIIFDGQEWMTGVAEDMMTEKSVGRERYRRNPI